MQRLSITTGVFEDFIAKNYMESIQDAAEMINLIKEDTMDIDHNEISQLADK